MSVHVILNIAVYSQHFYEPINFYIIRVKMRHLWKSTLFTLQQSLVMTQHSSMWRDHPMLGLNCWNYFCSLSSFTSTREQKANTYSPKNRICFKHVQINFSLSQTNKIYIATVTKQPIITEFLTEFLTSKR